MSRRPFLLLLSAGLGLMTSVQVGRAAPPKPDFTNLPGYIKALGRSRDPQAILIRQEIADGPAALARERAAAQAEGIPLDAALLQRPLPPPDRNAAPLYQQLDALRHAKPLRLPNYADALRGNYAYTPAQLAAVQTIIDSRRDVFDLLQQAASKPECVFTRNWSAGAAVLFPDMAGLREDARELTTESYLLAHRGNYADAVATQALGFRIAQGAASDPTLINYLVGVAIDAITLDGLKNILYAAGPRAAVSAQVQGAIVRGRPTLSLKNALIGEVGITLTTLEPLRTHSAEFPQAFVAYDHHPAPLPPDQAQFAGNLVAAAEARYLSKMRRLIAVADQPDSVRDALFQSLSRPFDSADATTRDMDPVMALDDKLTYSDFVQSLNVDKRTRATEQVTLAAAAVLAAKAQMGAFPATLPGDFFDPFTDRPLGYRREGPYGFVVYSVGVNGTFNGGGPGQYVFTPTQAFFRYPGPQPQPVPVEALK